MSRNNSLYTMYLLDTDYRQTMKDNLDLPLPTARCLSKEQAADYLGIGVTLLMELSVPHVRFGRRCVFDKVDLDAWLDDYKQRGRAG